LARPGNLRKSLAASRQLIRRLLHTFNDMVADLKNLTDDLNLQIAQRETAEKNLQQKVNDLKTFNQLAVNRETRMIELKNEVDSLLCQLDQTPKYGPDFQAIEKAISPENIDTNN
jgi:hypothetical protein